MSPIPNDGAHTGIAAHAELTERDRRRAETLLELLRDAPGEKNALSVEKLAAAMNVSGRKVRTLVTHLRANGLPVLATPDTGYFWPRSREEAEHTLAFLSARIASTTAVRRGIERGLEEVFGEAEQLDLLGAA